MTAKSRRDTSLEQTWHQWSTFVTNTASWHGLKWRNWIQQHWIGTLILLVAIAMMITVPYKTIETLVDELRDDVIDSKIDMNYSKVQDAPTLVFCHPLYFKKSKILDLGIAEDYLDTFASYLTYSVDLFTGVKVRASKVYRPRVDSHMDEFNSVLNKTMTENNISSILDLYRVIALECSDFLVWCDTLVSFIDGPVCCEQFFKGPVFSSAGVCYIEADQTPIEIHGIISQSVLFFDTAEDKTPLFKFELAGADTLSRRSIRYFFTFEKHITFESSMTAATLPVNYHTFVPFEIVETNSNDLQGVIENDMNTCMSDRDKQEFEKLFPGLEYSHQLCVAIWNDWYMFNNCSTLPFLGIEKARPDVPTCTPSDIIRNKRLGDISQIPFMCYGDCVRRAVSTIHTFRGDLNKKLLLTEVDSEKVKNPAGLSFYLKAKEKYVIVKKKASFMEILGGIGGALGLWLGASVISLAEMVIFLLILVIGLIRWIVINGKKF